ncbi:PREDICTED: protein ITFG3 isoform X2 [Sturnus vulgaris]|uniref:protein ITFG3 isoform X2 n=1 Tax=Sturnus vulgaris TaxID=9172 RepID=UPI00071AA967|nr:PREDICTED: protein ITFG3 isoform X2 [Sturnus vulgaris]
MDNKDSEAEIHPLKTEDVKAQENHEHFVERRIVKSSGLSRLSRWRTAAFFISLFLCLVIVFAFSFIIPCPERPVSERTWFQYYNSAVPYPFLAIEDVNADKVQDVLFAFKSSNGSSSFNVSCLDEGEVLWRQSHDFGANYTVLTPLSVIPDVDEDGVQDLIIFITKGAQVKFFIHSGKTGQQVGSTGSLSMDGNARYVTLHLHSSSYFLFYTEKSLYAYSLKDLCSAAVGREVKLSDFQLDSLWEKHIDHATHRLELLSLLSFGDIHYLAKVPGHSRDNILVVNSEMATLINTKDLHVMWTLNVSRLLSEPLLGYYKPDDHGIILESEIGPNRKKIMIVESESGAVQWELKLNSRAGSPGPATLPTADHRSAFLMWGDYQEPGNETTHRAPLQKLYLFHPSYTHVLLELRNSTDQIIAFTAALFERSRHACYVLLRGPQPGEEPGPVSLMKRKLKEDVSVSRVIWLHYMAGDEEQHIRDRLYRMRFQSRD